ncbi:MULTISPECIES: cupredoxin domain-containing protein [Paenibacillus]|uniref:EfeO-type cupredoxin-like domain-containing protein n=1 Tax=Paenibacillus apis TaxID=1792174 RepID=A0A920CMG4_9BACL|nr:MULTISPECIES: cupredoxin domain-containing protein [Paenibacillus]GIO42669.1 hypothetical protein J41TS4_24270 [Paenibacillus apis]
MRKTIALLMLCVLLTLASACSSNSNSAASTEAQVKPEAELVIEAVNYEFDQKEYRVKKDVPVQITFKNVEGNHGILIPGLRVQLSGKKDSVVITPKEAGKYEIACSIMCGSGHGTMVSTLIVE